VTYSARSGVFSVPAPSVLLAGRSTDGASYRLGRATVGCNNTTKFSEVQTVASRNSLYRILAINVALGVGQRAKMQLYSTWIGLRKGPRGGDCYRELRRILLPRRWVNGYDGNRDVRCEENPCGKEEGSSRDIKKTRPKALFFPLQRFGPGSQAGTLAKMRSGLNPITLDKRDR
jgi:hypothetical protein